MLSAISFRKDKPGIFVTCRIPSNLQAGRICISFHRHPLAIPFVVKKSISNTCEGFVKVSHIIKYKVASELVYLCDSVHAVNDFCKDIGPDSNLQKTFVKNC